MQCKATTRPKTNQQLSRTLHFPTPLRAHQQAHHPNLHAVSGEGEVGTVRALLTTGGAKRTRDEPGAIPLHQAFKKGHIRVVEALLAAGAGDGSERDSEGMTPLHHACPQGQLEVVEVLLTAGADTGVRNRGGGWTALHSACTQGYDDDVVRALHSACAQGYDDDMARALLDANADKDAKSNAGWTPLHLASAKGHVEVTRAWVEHKELGTLWCVRNEDHKTPYCLTENTAVALMLRTGMS